MVTLINGPFAIACECVNNVIKIKRHFQTKHYEIIYLQLVMQLAFSVIKSAIKRLDASGGAYGEKISLALEAVFMQMFVPRWHHLAPQIQNETFLELD